MRDLDVRQITTAVRDACIEAAHCLPADVRRALAAAAADEPGAAARSILELLVENARVAVDCDIPICQDTGMAVVFVELGQEVHLRGGGLQAAVDEGVREGYLQGYLRKSVVADPLRRDNTGDNTPAILHLDLVPGDRVRLTVLAKGFGSENMSGVRMLTPADGAAGVRRYVAEVVRKAGANPCPPLVIGVGLGGTLETAALLAKKALLRPVGAANPALHLAQLESALCDDVQATGVGPQGLGGRTTALAVHVLAAPTHIAALPVAVNLSCHALRRAVREV